MDANYSLFLTCARSRTRYFVTSNVFYFQYFWSSHHVFSSGEKPGSDVCVSIYEMILFEFFSSCKLGYHGDFPGEISQMVFFSENITEGVETLFYPKPLCVKLCPPPPLTELCLFSSISGVK